MTSKGSNNLLGREPTDPVAIGAATRYLDASNALTDRSFWPLKMSVALNLFLWHLSAFEQDADPVPMFVSVFNKGSQLLETARECDICSVQYPATDITNNSKPDLETLVSELFSDIWQGLSDDIYFDQTYKFTRERFEKNKIDPEKFFGGKVVLDAGCGSGKFSAAIARFGAQKVIGIDIGVRGLEFARTQAEKLDYGNRLEFRKGSLLNIPLASESIDLVWSNGVVHHTSDYGRCIQEFGRVIKPGGVLFLYVNGRFGLFELLLDTLRRATSGIPRELFQHFLITLGTNSGRIYWIMDCLYAPYEWKSKADVTTMLRANRFGDIRQLTRGVASDQIEQVWQKLPYAVVKYGEAQLKFIARKLSES